MTVGQEEDEKAAKEACRVWKKAHPGFAGEIRHLLDRAYGAGFGDGMVRGEEKRGCCHEHIGGDTPAVVSEDRNA